MSARKRSAQRGRFAPQENSPLREPANTGSAAGAREQELNPSSKGKGRILVVDDNEAGRYALARCLRASGYEVQEVGTGEECVERVRTGEVDLVLLDVKLPGISGIEACKQLKSEPQTALIPVIQVSAMLISAQDRIQGLESGADAYLSSPFQPGELLAHVEGLLRLRRLEERLRLDMARRIRAEDALTRREGNLAFLAELANAFAHLSSADDIMGTVGARLGEYLDAESCNFCEVDDRRDEITVLLQWQRPGAPDLRQTFRMSDFYSEEFKQASRLGKSIAIADTQTDPRTAASAYAAIGIRSFLSVPFLKKNQWKNSLTVTAAQPREWRPDEVELFQAWANVVFPRIERARAETALRESEEKYRHLFNSIDEGFFLIDVIFDEKDRPVDLYYVEANAAAKRIVGRDYTGLRLTEISPHYERYWFEIFGNVALTGQSIRLERYAAPDKRWYSFYVFKVGDPNSRRVGNTFQDITERKRAEEALRQSEERARVLGDTMFQGVVHQDAQGRIIAMNPAAEEILGKTKEEFLGSSSVQEDKDCIREDGSPFPGVEHPAMVSLRTGKPIRGVAMGVWNPRLNERRWLSIDAVPIFRGAESRPPEVYTLFADVTERKRAEEALRASERHYRRLIETAAEGVWLIDARGRTTFANAKMGEILGYRVEEMLGKHLFEFMDDEGQAQAKIYLRRREQGISEQHEFRFRHKDGRDVWTLVSSNPLFDEQGNYTDSLGMVTDITEKKRTEDALRKSEAMLARAQEVANLGSWEWDIPSDTLVWSDQTYRIFGLTPGELKPNYERFLSFLEPDDREQVKRAVEEVLAGKPYRVEYQVIRPDGVRRNILAEGRVDFDALGKPIRMLGTTLDITERKQAEEVVEQSERMLSELIERCPFGIYIVDAEFRIAKMNARSQEGAFRNVRPLLGRPFAEAMRVLWPEPVATEIIGHFRHTLDTGKPYYSRDFMTARSDVQDTEAYEWELHRMRLPDGQQAVICYYYDSTDLRKAEKEIQELLTAVQKERDTLSTLVNSMTDEVWFADAQKRFILANPPALWEFGLASGTDTDIVQLAAKLEVLRPDGSPRPIEEAPPLRALRGEVVRNEEELIRTPATGEYRYRQVSSAPVKGAAGEITGSVSVARDITEQKRAEEAVRRSEEKFRRIFDSNMVGVAFWHADGSLFDANQAFCDLIGCTPEEVRAGKVQWSDVTPPEILERDRKAIQEINETGVCTPYEKVFLHRDGQPRTFIVGGAKLGNEQDEGVAFAVDISERKRIEAALRESEERFRVAQEMSPDGFSIFRPVRDEQGRLVDFIWLYENATAARVTGIEPKKILGQRLLELFPGYRGSEFFRAYEEVAETGKRRVFEAQYSGPTVAPTWFRLAVVPVGGDVAVLAQDITQQKEFQAELQRQVDERTAKLQDLVGELEHFSYTITHDLKSPLRAMRGFADAVSDLAEQWGNAEAKDFLQRISMSADRMDALIRDALSYSQAVRQELPLDDIDTGALLRGMLDTYPELQASKAHIRVEEPLPVVLGNEAGLTQCFSNLLCNAVKFVKPGEIPEVRVWGETRESWARICIEDKGIGISREMLPRVFHMFSRGNKTYEGTGIGLALVRKVAHRMGGKVGVESEEGKGTRFWLELKTGQLKPLPKTEAVATLQATAGTVLYVEDEESDALFMERAFVKKGLGSTLRLVCDGRAAIDYLSGAGRYAQRTEYPLPSLVLLDLNLPLVQGFEVLKWIRNNPDYASTPVVVFSSSALEGDQVTARELGANDFVVKPNSGLDFGGVVDGLREKWLGNSPSGS